MLQWFPRAVPVVALVLVASLLGLFLPDGFTW